MANSKQARKRAKQNDKRRLANGSKRATLRTFMKNVRKAVAEGQKDLAAAALKKAVPVIDKMAGKGIIHTNAANRYKSRLNAAVKNMAA